MQTLYFLYHELRTAKSDYSYAIDVEEFKAQAKFLAESTRAAETGAAGRLVKPCITFDDGHLSDYEYALPVLERQNLTAHFFITAGWTAQRAGYMGWEQLRALHAAGQHVGAHGWSHTLLTHCKPGALRTELRDSKMKLEDGLGAAVPTMSLPGGRFNRRVLDACWEAGYQRVFTSEPRTETGTGKLAGRLNLLATSNVRLLAALLAPESPELAALGRQYRLKRAVNAVLGDALYARVWALVNRQEASQQASQDASQDAHDAGTGHRMV